MGFQNDIANALRSRWKTLVEDALSIRTKYPNAPFAVPAAGSVDVWAEYNMEVIESEQMELSPSSALVRHIGYITANLYFKQGGTAQSPKITVDQIVPLFRMLTVTAGSEIGIVFRVPRPTTIGDYREWYAVNLTCPFFVDEVT